MHRKTQLRWEHYKPFTQILENETRFLKTSVFTHAVSKKA